MTIAILVFTILNCVNTFLIVLIMLSIYGKCNDAIEYLEKAKEAIKDFAKGLSEGLKKT